MLVICVCGVRGYVLTLSVLAGGGRGRRETNDGFNFVSKTLFERLLGPEPGAFPWPCSLPSPPLLAL